MQLNISDAEMVVMRVIWSMGTVKVDDVVTQTQHRQNWSVATIKTLLGRLVKKGVLTTTKDGRSFIYTPTISEDKVLMLLAHDLMDKICATKQEDLLKHLLSVASLREDQIQSLNDCLQDKVPVDVVTCSCLEELGACDYQHEQEVLATNPC